MLHAEKEYNVQTSSTWFIIICKILSNNRWDIDGEENIQMNRGFLNWIDSVKKKFILKFVHFEKWAASWLSNYAIHHIYNLDHHNALIAYPYTVKQETLVVLTLVGWRQKTFIEFWNRYMLSGTKSLSLSWKNLVISRVGSRQEFCTKFTKFEIKSSSVSIKYFRFHVYTSSIQIGDYLS